MATLLAELTENGIRRCDARCYNARGPECRCCCGGRHHGQGFKSALAVNQEWAERHGFQLPPVQMDLEFSEDS